MYPILCFAAVVSLDVHLDMFFGLLSQIVNIPATPRRRAILHGLVWVPMGALSLLRVAALHKYYSAPLSIYAAIHSSATTGSSKGTPQLVCTCGEWYRFPSSFTLPPEHELAFLPSSFQGQLPQPFSKYGSSAESQQVLQPFNDQNQHEPTRYSHLNDCAYVVDLDESTDCAMPATAIVLATAPFLDADRTVSTLHRTLYIPYVHEKAIEQGIVHYQNYVVYKLYA
jgi:alpha-1,2-mannosyltransferase